MGESYESLYTKHKAFRAPSAKILVDKKEIDRDKINIISIVVSESALNDKSGICDIEISDVFDTKTSKLNEKVKSTFVVDKPIEIQMGYASTECVFYGLISGVKLNFSSSDGSGVIMSVQGVDGKGILKKAKECSAENNPSTNDVVKKLLTNCTSAKAAKKIEVGQLMNFETPLRQSKTTDNDFLEEIAKYTLSNYYMSRGTAFFKNALSKVDKCISLEYGKSLISFEHEISMDNQVISVEVTGVDLTQKKVTGKSTDIGMAGKGKWAGQICKQDDSLEESVDVQLATSEDLAKKIAKALLTWKAMNLVRCKGTCIGLPEIQVGKWMQVEGMSDYIDSEYFITDVTHIYDENGYITKFNLKGAKKPK